MVTVNHDTYRWIALAVLLAIATGCSSDGNKASAEKSAEEAVEAMVRRQQVRDLSREAIAALKGIVGAQFEARFHGWNKWMFTLWDEGTGNAWSGFAVLMARDRFCKPIEGLRSFHGNPMLTVPLRNNGDVAPFYEIVTGKEHPTLKGELSSDYKAFLARERR